MLSEGREAPVRQQPQTHDPTPRSWAALGGVVSTRRRLASAIRCGGAEAAAGGLVNGLHIFLPG